MNKLNNLKESVERNTGNYWDNENSKECYETTSVGGQYWLVQVYYHIITQSELQIHQDSSLPQDDDNDDDSHNVNTRSV